MYRIDDCVIHLAEIYVVFTTEYYGHCHTFIMKPSSSLWLVLLVLPSSKALDVFDGITETLDDARKYFINTLPAIREALHTAKETWVLYIQRNTLIED